MPKDIDLNSNAWISLVFQGKNKDYGAYYLRRTSSKRHIRALLIIVVICILVIFLPILIKTVIPQKSKQVEVGPVELSNLDIKKAVPKQNQIQQPKNVPPPPKLKASIKFVPPVIVKDNQVTRADMLKTVEELKDSKAAISVADVKGATNGSGTDIADLQKHQVVVQGPKEENTDEENKVFTHVETMPEFPGGPSELMKYLSDNIKYPVIAQEQGIQGTVVLHFVVDKSGSVGNVTVLRSLDPSCDREAVRVVKGMPNWIPGKQNGRSVNVWYTLPVRFKLNE